MPIQLQVWERRDNADRVAIGTKALEACRIIKAMEGIRSCRYYWSGADTVVLIVEGDIKALNQPAASPDAARLVFEFSDMARLTQSLRLSEPFVGEAQYRAAGRMK